MSDHIGQRRRRGLPVGKLLGLAVAVVAIIRLLTLGDPVRAPAASGASPFTVVAPTWSGPPPARTRGVLTDGATYAPRLFFTADTSVGVATSADGNVVRIVLAGPGDRVTELRRLTAADHAQFNGFAVSGDTLVWMESLSRSGSGTVTTLWRESRRSSARPVQITTNTGEANFFGAQSDVVIADGRAYWTAVASGAAPVTEVRSVPLTGGQVATKRYPGEYALTGWPYAVSVTGGKGKPVDLVNLTTDAHTSVATGPGDVPVCAPTWCRMAVAGGDALVGIDLVHPDGSDRRRIAGSEATPTIADATLLDRFVPLATDHAYGGSALSLYDLHTGHTDLVATRVANIQGRDGVLWWSAGVGANLAWYAVDLRVLS